MEMLFVNNFRLSITNLEHLLVEEQVLRMEDVQEVLTPVLVVRGDMEDSTEVEEEEGGGEVVVEVDHTVLETNQKLKKLEN